MRTCVVFQACALGILVAGCADNHQVGARVSNPTRAAGVSLACGLDQPWDTLSGLDRCLLEAWQPCRIDRSGSDAWSIELTYDSGGRLRLERRTSTPRATRMYAYDGEGLLRDVVQTGFEPFEEDHTYREGRVDASSRTIFHPSEVDYFYDDKGRLVGVDRAISQPYRARYEWRDGRLATINRSLFQPIEISLSYDAEGFLDREESLGSRPYLRTFAYDDRGRIDVETREGSEPYVAYFDWDAADRITRIERTQFEPHMLALTYLCD